LDPEAGVCTLTVDQVHLLPFENQYLFDPTRYAGTLYWTEPAGGGEWTNFVAAAPTNHELLAASFLLPLEDNAEYEVIVSNLVCTSGAVCFGFNDGTADCPLAVTEAFDSTADYVTAKLRAPAGAVGFSVYPQHGAFEGSFDAIYLTATDRSRQNIRLTLRGAVT